jgi:hypothetical protein
METNNVVVSPEEKQIVTILPSQVYASVSRKVSWKDPQDRFQSVEIQLGYTLPFEEEQDFDTFQRHVWASLRVGVTKQVKEIMGEIKTDPRDAVLMEQLYHPDKPTIPLTYATPAPTYTTTEEGK